MSKVILAIADLSVLEAANANDAKEVKLVAKVNDLVTKLKDAGGAVVKYVGERTAAELASKVEVGNTVAFAYGRAETKKELSGKVLAVVETPSGKLLKVLAGEGAEMKVYDVRSKDATVQAQEGTNEGAGEASAKAPTNASGGAEGGADGAAGGLLVDVDALICCL